MMYWYVCAKVAYTKQKIDTLFYLTLTISSISALPQICSFYPKHPDTTCFESSRQIRFGVLDVIVR